MQLPGYRGATLLLMLQLEFTVSMVVVGRQAVGVINGGLVG